MSTMKYTVWSRYEYWGKEGRQFTKWFITKYKCDDEQSAKDEIKNLKESSDLVDKITKNKHEYEIRYIDIDELPKPSPPKKRGRPKKVKEENN